MLIDKRLKEKEGTHKTFLRISLEDRVMVPMCVTLVVSPLGNSTTVCVTVVMLVNKSLEHTIWSVVPLSKTQMSNP